MQKIIEKIIENTIQYNSNMLKYSCTINSPIILNNEKED